MLYLSGKSHKSLEVLKDLVNEHENIHDYLTWKLYLFLLVIKIN
jgi:hypothetical protein